MAINIRQTPGFDRCSSGIFEKNVSCNVTISKRNEKKGEEKNCKTCNIIKANITQFSIYKVFSSVYVDETEFKRVF